MRFEMNRQPFFAIGDDVKQGRPKVRHIAVEVMVQASATLHRASIAQGIPHFQFTTHLADHLVNEFRSAGLPA